MLRETSTGNVDCSCLTKYEHSVINVHLKGYKVKLPAEPAARLGPKREANWRVIIVGICRRSLLETMDEFEGSVDDHCRLLWHLVSNRYSSHSTLDQDRLIVHQD